MRLGHGNGRRVRIGRREQRTRSRHGGRRVRMGAGPPESRASHRSNRVATGAARRARHRELPVPRVRVLQLRPRRVPRAPRARRRLPARRHCVALVPTAERPRVPAHALDSASRPQAAEHSRVRDARADRRRHHSLHTEARRLRPLARLRQYRAHDFRRRDSLVSLTRTLTQSSVRLSRRLVERWLYHL